MGLTGGPSPRFPVVGRAKSGFGGVAGGRWVVEAWRGIANVAWS